MGWGCDFQFSKNFEIAGTIVGAMVGPSPEQ
jgi:hypothetical protein